MKKALSVVLAAIMLLTVFSGMTVTAVDADTVMYWSFEDTTLEQMKEATAQSFYTGGTVAIVEGGFDGTGHALKVTNANSGNGEWLHGLKPSTEYKVTFWAKTENRASGAWPNLGVSDYNGSAYVAEQNFTDTWTQYSLSFTTAADKTSAKVYSWVFGEGNVDFYLDEVTVREAKTTVDPQPSDKYLTAWDFEDNDIAALGTASGSDEDGYYASGLLSVVAGGANGTGYALKIRNANSGNGQWLNGLKPATSYVISFWAKMENRDSNAWPNVGVSDYDGSAYIAEQNFTDTWAQYSLSFTTGADVTSAKFYTWVFGEGSVDFYLDEVTVAEKISEQDNGTLNGWNFEAGSLTGLQADSAYYQAGKVSVVEGGANRTNYALLVQNANSGNGQWLTGLKPSTAYEITFWVKLANRASTAWPNVGVSDYDGSAYIAEQNFTEEWAQYSLSFTTAAGKTSAKFYTWVFGEGNVDFYIDECVLREKTEAVEGGTLNGWNFEAGKLDGLQADEAYYQSGNLSVAAGGANGTGYALKITDTNSGNGQWLNNLLPDTAYEITYWAKAENRDETAYPNVGVSDYNGEQYVSEQNFTEEWAQYSLTFTTGAENTSAKFYTWIFGEGKVDFYLDEVTIKEKIDVPAPGTLTSWNFESGSLAVLTADPAYYQSGKLSVVEGGADGTAHALLIQNVNSGNGQWLNDLKPDTIYDITFWAKSVNCAPAAYPNVGVSNFDGDKYQTEQYFSSEWGQYTLSFRTGAESTSAKFYTWIFGEGNVDFYIDEVVLTERPEAPEPTDPCEGYTDINRSSWYHSAADFVIRNGYMGSTKTDKLVFEPNTKVSRAMVASIMYRIAGSPDVEYKGSFTDVPSGKWFTAAIEWAAQNGLASGKGAGKFDPNGNVTRQELAVFMYKLADFRGRAVSAAADLSEFEDAAKVPAWAKSYVQWAVADGLISGKSSNGKTLLAPTDNASRAEFASIIMRFINARIDPNNDGTLAILMVCNSYGVDTMQYVWHIARSAGIENIVLGMLYYGGCTIDQHYGFWANNLPSYEFIYMTDESGWVTQKDAVYTDGLDFCRWDYVSYQQASSRAASKESFAHLTDLISMTKAHCPNAKLFYNMTWCRPDAYTEGSEYPSYADIVKSVNEVVDTYGFFEVTTPGTAIENLRTSYIDKALLYRDDVHLSYGIGRYTAGLALFTQLTGISVENLEYRPGSVSEEYQLLAIEAAMNSARNRRETTPSQYPEKPE